VHLHQAFRPAGTQNGQLVGTDDSRKRCCLSPGSSGIMKPCTLTVFWCSACTSAGKLGMSFFFSALAVTWDSSSRTARRVGLPAA
jgi:hypothetical protein